MNRENDSKQKILIVDDSEMNRAILSEILNDEYDIVEAGNGAEAVAFLQKNANEISVVLLDIVMPVMDGYEVLEMMNSRRWIDDIPVIMISAESSSDSIDRAYELGVTDFIARPFDALIVRRRVINTILLYAKQKKLSEMVSDQIYENEKISNMMITVLSHIVEFRNGESGLHVLHVQTITDILLRRLVQITDKYKLSASDMSLITTASALHDIGKISIPDEILNKPGRLTDEEFAIMKTHSSIGSEMLDEMAFYKGEPLIRIAYEICRWHHERYDGRGYPDGLKGDEIPISAQIVAVADVYDALTSERVYKKAFSHDKAISMIVNGECGTFNPLLLECLQELGTQLQDELKQNAMSYHVDEGIQDVAEVIHQHSELSASEKTLQLLEYERSKYDFFSNKSQEIQFEYASNPAMLKLSAWSAEQLHLDEIILDPLDDSHIIDIFGEKGLKTFEEGLAQATLNQTDVEFDCEMVLNNEKQVYHFIIRTVWEDGHSHKYTKFFGKMIKRDSIR